jgi:2-phosphosulfolactate phosphatase
MDVTIFSALKGISQAAIPRTVWVVIDVLRASTTILCLMEKGVKKIRIVGTIEEALTMKAEGYTPIGERGDEPLPGFEFDNSPYAVLQNDWREKKVVLTTTNGTRALVAVKEGYQVLVAGFRNIDAVAATLNTVGYPAAIVPIGDLGSPRLEDELCAHALQDRIAGKPVDWKAIKEQVSEERRAKIQVKGWMYAEDIELALTPNACSIVPILAPGMTLVPKQGQKDRQSE